MAFKELQRQNYNVSLSLFTDYISRNKSIKNKKVKEKVFWSIDTSLRIYLRINKDPDGAISFINKILKKYNFSDAEEDILLEWLSVSKEWKKLGKMPKTINSANELFELGKKYYQKGLNDQENGILSKSKPNLYIAATYLVPYVYNYDNSKNIGEALFMLGNIRYRSWNDHDYWTENFYLKEVIRRFPHTDLSKRAYEVLSDGIEAGYTGSSGNNTPPSQRKMLLFYKKLAYPKKVKKPVVY
jgi:hypothetical protein